MKKLYAAAGATIIIGLAITLAILRSNERQDQLHYERKETELLLSDIARASATLFKTGRELPDSVEMPRVNAQSTWLSPGNYFLKVELTGKATFYPIAVIGYRGGPDKDGSFAITISPLATDESPPRLSPNSANLAFIPSGHFLFGDHLRVQEPHYVLLTGFFLGPFEVTNGEFSKFLNDPQ